MYGFWPTTVQLFHWTQVGTVGKQCAPTRVDIQWGQWLTWLRLLANMFLNLGYWLEFISNQSPRVQSGRFSRPRLSTPINQFIKDLYFCEWAYCRRVWAPIIENLQWEGIQYERFDWEKLGILKFNAFSLNQFIMIMVSLDSLVWVPCGRTLQLQKVFCWVQGFVSHVCELSQA